jgi:outer membrane receptor protein involved in Fe transport
MVQENLLRNIRNDFARLVEAQRNVATGKKLHAPSDDPTGGGYGIINGDFIQNVTFSAGGFSAAYGDKLSSITEITFREGNREKYEGRVDANFAGIAAAAEGPIIRGKASWLFSIRRSFLQFLTDKVDVDFTPNFGDFQGRLLFDIRSRNRLSMLIIASQDQIDLDKERAIEGGHNDYGKVNSNQVTLGINWRYLYGSKGYSNTSLAILRSDRDKKFLYIVSNLVRSSSDTRKRSLRLRHITVYRLGESGHLEGGFDAKHYRNDYEFYSGDLYNPLGGTYPGGTYQAMIESGSLGIFASLTLHPISQLNTTLGLRYDYFDYTGRGHFSPRFAFALGIADNTTLTGAIGIYQQCLPLGMYGRDETARQLKDPVAYHYILGINRLVTETTKLTLEGYVKRYNFFPLDARQPRLFIVDGLLYWDYLGYFRNMVDAGKAKTYGIELTLQKRLTGGFYGIMCGSYSRSKYLGLDGIWRNRVVDNRLSLATEAGYRPGNSWQFRLRWIFAGGAAFTPFDIEKSISFNKDVYDISRINGARYPDYHMLTLRIERQFHFWQSNLSLYLELYNLYNRKNVSQYYWNERDRRQDSYDQYGFLPLLGLEMEF